MKGWRGGRGWSAVRGLAALGILLLPGGLVVLALLALALRRLRSEPVTTAA